MRMTPLPGDQWDDDVRAALKGMLPRERQNPEGAGPMLSTLVRHPDLAKAFLGFSRHLLFSSTLPPRLREVAILRVAHRRQCAYEWSHHVELGMAEGLTGSDIEGITAGKASDPVDQLVLDAVEELEVESSVSDATWAALSDHLDEHQRMDLVFTVGSYGMLAMALNTFEVPREEGR